MTRSYVQCGLDRISDGDVIELLRGRRLGLLAHPASVDAHLVHASDVLRRAGCEIAAYFGPEHGYGGEAQDMVGVEGARHPETGAPIYSLYGDDEAALTPKPEWLQGLDAVVVDLQDVGSRYYTFVWTAALMLRAASAAGIPTIVLDRPNPLGGETVEGAPQRPGYRSFVGLYDVAVRHGMTIGELCRRVQRLEGLDAQALVVVSMRGWQRATGWPPNRPWVLPSPNMPTLDTAMVYPGGCLVEGTQLSEGRGTTRPFELWGAPFLDGARLARSCTISGAVLRPVGFTPMFHKFARQRCGGVQIHVVDAASFRPYAAYLVLLAAARAQAPAQFAWRTEPYEYVSDRPAIDLLTGGPEYRQAVDDGAGLDEALAHEELGAAAFDRSRQADLLYR